MKIRFWGVRGSTPTPEMDKLKVGGNTSCIELEFDNGRRIILDSGSGIRRLGQKLSKNIEEGANEDLVIFLSHMHWDHIQGFPFFSPIFNPDVKIKIYGPSKANRTLERVLSGQMEYDYWPVKFTQLPANIKFFELSEGYHSIGDNIKIEAKRHIHPGIAFGYRIEYNGKSIVYSTDTEHFKNMIDKRVLDLSMNADILIHDAQYTDDEMEFKLGWGHSSWRQAIQVAKEANVKKLILFHHDPLRTDDEAVEIEKQAKDSFEDVEIAREQMEIEL